MFAFYPFFHMQISRQKFTITPFLLQYLISRDEMRSANLALISGRQMHRINACIFLVAITKTQNQSIFLFGSALRLSVWLIYNLSFKLFYIYKILSPAFRTKQWLMIQHGIFPYFRPCIPTTCRAGNSLIYCFYRHLFLKCKAAFKIRHNALMFLLQAPIPFS